ncbi:hypothetical protein BV20DRAFT_945672 [Pilatotrama ljubarskyi]|nr:hypothetical protein BV20DRAFT_945672 [Pilatotrama ljubarskyi]
MRDALSGRVLFSAGEGFVDSSATVTLEEVLAGAGLFEAVSAAHTAQATGGDPSGWLEEEPPSTYAVDETQDSVAQELLGSRTMSREGSDYFPYPDKGMMKTDILFSAPELRFSRAQQEAILAWGKDLGAREVPSLYKLDKFQKDALEACGNPAVRVQSASGNVFYHNSVGHMIAQDYAHPDVRPQIRAYPLFSGGRVSETWQASKWLVDAPDHLLTPMVRLRDKDFYVNELTHCMNGQWFIPTRFFEFEGQGMWAVGHHVRAGENGLEVEEKRMTMSCAMFLQNWPEIEASKGDKAASIFAPNSREYAAKMPNADRLTAAGLEWESPPLIIFIDDVSGNSSKQWNVHYSCYMSNGALPRHEIEKSRNVKFVATSPHASPMEIIQAVCDDIRHGGTTPLRAWDAIRKRYILVRPWILFLPGDNPMQAELCSHIGLKGNHFCRCCHVGGDKAFKESDDGFASLLQPGRTRTVAETQQAIMSQLFQATHAAAEKPLKNAITSSGTKDSLAMPTINRLLALGKAFRRATPERKALTPEAVNKELHKELLKKRDVPLINPLLKMDGLDVHQDTPVETLHTHLLGVVKYFWAQTIWVLEKKGGFTTFQARLNSLAKSGLKIPNIMADYMCRYRGALIGKHFKTISQVMSFAVCGLVEDELQNAWLAIGDLTVLLWETEIVDINKYADTLEKAIQDVLDFAAALSPSLLTEKNKLHILTHLPAHIRRHGPALLFSTERYESFNHIFRLCSIHSNRQAPSRDIAAAFANQERCRHMVTGGYWYSTADKRWVCAGPAVQEHIQAHTLDAQLLGVPVQKPTVPGRMALAQPSKDSARRPERSPAVPWSRTESAGIDSSLKPPSGAKGPWQRAASVIAVSGDSVAVGDEVLVSLDSASSPNECHRFASVVELLRAEDQLTDVSLVVVRISVLGKDPHPQLRMPQLRREGDLLVLEPKATRCDQDIICAVNVQHDCTRGLCISSNTEHVRQEREVTLRTRTTITHTDKTHFVLNMHGLHNHSLIRSCLPAALLSPKTYFPANERMALHRTAAESLRDTKLQKKLAKEAAIRKTAEDALAKVNKPGTIDLLGLGVPEDDTGSHLAISTPVVDGRIAAPPNRAPVVAPRGPRQRRAKTAATSSSPGGEFIICCPKDSTQRPKPTSQSVIAVAAGGGASQASDRSAAPSSLTETSGAQAGPTGMLAVGQPEHRSWMSQPSLFTMESSHSPVPEDYHQIQPAMPTDASSIAQTGFKHARVDDDDAGDHLRIRGRPSGQILRARAEEQCQMANLTGKQMDAVQSFCNLSPTEMLIDLKIHLYHIENDILKRYFRLYAKHPDFYTRLRSCISAVLCAYNVPAYVNNITTSMTNYISDHLDSVALTQECRDDAADWAIVKTTIADQITQFRSGLKTKIDLAIKNKDDIYQLTTALLSSMYETRARKEHWGRFAFLRDCAIQYSKCVPHGERTKRPFWVYVDEKLKEVRIAHRDGWPEPEARKLQEALFFAQILQKDIKAFKIKSGGVAQTAITGTKGVPNMQLNMEKIVAAFIVDDSAEDHGSAVPTSALVAISAMEHAGPMSGNDGLSNGGASGMGGAAV